MAYSKPIPGSGTLRKRADGRWEIRCALGRNPKTGKLIQKSVYGKTQKEVIQKLKNIEPLLYSEAYREMGSLDFKKWAEIWLNDYLMNVKPSTAFEYKRIMESYIYPTFGNKHLENINPYDIQILYNSLYKGGKDRNPLSAKSVKDIHGVMHHCLKQAVSLGYMASNPATNCVLPRAEKKEMKPMNDFQMELFIDAIKGTQYEYEFKVLLFTGMREAELLGLQWSCVDFKNGTIIIDKQLVKEKQKGGQYILLSPKNGKARTIVPAQYVIDILRAQKTRQVEMKANAGSAWQESGFVFTNEIGRYVSYRALYDNFKRIVKKIGCKNVRVHDLRHTFAVNSIRAGDNIKAVQANLGHGTAAFTLDVYGHATDDMKYESSEKMNKFIKERFLE